jgi:hypothetical protein
MSSLKEADSHGVVAVDMTTVAAGSTASVC